MFARPDPPAGGLYLRLSVTERCDLRCRYCSPSSHSSQPALGDDRIVELVAALDDEVGLRKIRLTGGEPLLRPGITELVRRLRARLPRAELALTSNGTRLTQLAAPLREAGVTALNVSLDALQPDRFAALTGRDRLEQVLQGLRTARSAGFERVKMNAVLLRSVNGDQLCELVHLAAELDCELRFIELMPLGPAAQIFEDEYLPAAAALARLRRELVYLGPEPRTGTAERHRFLDGDRPVSVGFIAPVSRPFCLACDRLRLDARGRLHACLRRSRGVGLAAIVEPERLRAEIRRVVGLKGKRAGCWPERAMLAIGG